MTTDSKIEEIFRLSPLQKTALKKMGLSTVHDLLYHFPTRYESLGNAQAINSIQKDDTVTLYGELSHLNLSKTYTKKINIADGILSDGSGVIKLIWFNQPYIAKMLKDGSFVRVSGKVMERKGELYIANPDISEIPKIPLSPHKSLFGEGEKESLLSPIYKESRGITSRWIYFALQKIFKTQILDTLTDPIPKDILDKYHLPTLKTALSIIHNPKNEKDALASRKRFAFEEVFLIQISLLKEKRDLTINPAPIVDVEKEKIEEFVKRFPFEATASQRKSIDTVLSDMKKGKPMSRLLEGDVGSGKTAVAAVAAFSAISTHPLGKDYGTLQVAYMAPTEILATQHFESFIKYFKHLDINIALLTGSVCRKFPSKLNSDQSVQISKAQLLKWVGSGEISIVIGTHALIQKNVKFKNLGLIVIDEQHRFGVKQRQSLARKNEIVPHLLSMTATPIPRTLALTIYGNLDLSLLLEMPKGRKPIETKIVHKNKREEAYEKIKSELEKGRQAYIICPRIAEPDPDKETALNAKSVIAEAERLKRDIFQKWNIGVLHGKMKPKDKDAVMRDFSEAKIDILVATSVVEVGVNVPNATLIVIEGAERFGLSQLHQLRGRVIRSEHQAYCFIFSDTESKKTFERLGSLVKAKNGFELAEEDLKLRGPGELSGMKQWGLSDLAMESMKNIKMVEAARIEASKIIETDPELKKYPLLKEASITRGGNMHWE